MSQLVVEEEFKLYAPVKVCTDRNVRFIGDEEYKFLVKFEPDKECLINRLYENWDGIHKKNLKNEYNDDGLISILGINLSTKSSKQYLELVHQYRYDIDSLNESSLEEVKLKDFNLLPKTLEDDYGYSYKYAVKNMYKVYEYDISFYTIEIDSKEYIIRGIYLENSECFIPLHITHDNDSADKYLNEFYNKYAIFFPRGKNIKLRIYRTDISNGCGKYKIKETHQYFYSYGEAELSKEVCNKKYLNAEMTEYAVGELVISDDYNIYAITSSFDGHERIISGLKLLEDYCFRYEEFSDDMDSMVELLYTLWEERRDELVAMSQESKLINIVEIHLASNKNDNSSIKIVQQFSYNSIHDSYLTMMPTIIAPNIQMVEIPKKPLYLSERILYMNRLYYYTILLPDGHEGVIRSTTEKYDNMIQRYKHTKEEATNHILKYYKTKYSKFPSGKDYMDYTIQMYEIKFDMFNKPIERTLVNIFCYDYLDTKLSELEYDDSLVELFGLK